MSPLLAVEGLNVSFATRRGELTAVLDLSYDLARGESLGVVGESGSGKTQAFLALLGLLPANGHASGRARFEETDLLRLAPRELNRIRGAKIGMIFQDPLSALTPHLRIGAQLTEVLRAHREVSRTAARRAALEMLAKVRLDDPERRLEQFPHELSGGMRQRAAIAMALLCRPALLIADEASTALDVTVAAGVLQVLKEMRHEWGLSLVLISHDIALLAASTDRLIVMYAGRAVECGRTRDLLRAPQHPYTQALLEAVPRLNRPVEGDWPSIAGQLPDPLRVPPGCAFAPRCTRVIERCHTQVPILREAGARASACHRPLQGAGG